MIVTKLDSIRPKFGVIGGGSWGTALAVLFARNGFETQLWVRDADQARQYSDARRNTKYLPDIPFPPNLEITSDLQAAATGKTDLVIVVPSRAFRGICRQLGQIIPSNTRLILATKGIEDKTLKLMHVVAHEELHIDRPTAVLSGPTFAKEVAAGLPTAVTVASNNTAYAQEVANFVHNDTFRAYTSQDVTGVEIGGAVKNVMAIAAGIADGLGFGANTRAALITRGLVEITRLGVAMGGHKETFMGLAGLGDLVLTSTDNQSRNRRVGMALAQGKKIKDILVELGQVAEGYYTAEEILLLAKQYNVEMPISEHVYRILYQSEDPRTAVHSLLSRAIRAENDK